MSSYSDYLKSVKENNINRFFGDVKYTSNKYFTFNRVISDDEIILITDNVKYIKGNPVLIISPNKAVYLKDWCITPVHNYFNDIYGYAVRLNRKFFKPYTFKTDFENIYIEKEYGFDDLLEIAKEQNEVNMKIALGN